VVVDEDELRILLLLLGEILRVDVSFVLGKHRGVTVVCVSANILRC
jgi:hypothetical protein